MTFEQNTNEYSMSKLSDTVKITMNIQIHYKQNYAQSTNVLTLATRSVSLTLAMCNFTRFVLLFKASA